jgi:hypothetical protein
MSYPIAALEQKVSTRTYAGVFFVALSTLMYEVLLTRIFSVTMFYHFAFVAISLAMFGMTVGALIVYLFPEVFRPETARRDLAASAASFPLAIVLSFLTQLSIPFRVHPSIIGVYSFLLTYAVIAVPFVASGVAIAVALTRFPARASQLYAADLGGAALGCLLIAPVVGSTDAPTAVLVVACLASVGALMLSIDAGTRVLRKIATASAVLLAAWTVVNLVFVLKGFPVFRILYIRGSFEARPLYEKWNSYSRVRVNGDPTELVTPTGWGLSAKMPADLRVRQLQMDIDVSAGTVMTGLDGNLDKLAHLRYDVTNIGYYLRQKPEVLVVGAGGGRDVLSALLFGASHVTAVEINKDILQTVNGRFGDFTGHLDRRPEVTFVNDEARSYIARQQRKYDIIQISLIDTWAATAAGAFVLSENSLYTTEAWTIFLQRLSDDGLLSVSRWYFRNGPAEVYRITTLATEALRHIGVEHPRDHVVIVRNMQLANKPELPDGVGTLLVSRRPFTADDREVIEERSREFGFDVVVSPENSKDPLLVDLLDPARERQVTASYPVRIAAPTDDSPFFFNMLRLRDVLHWRLLDYGKQSHNMKAVFVLAVLLVTVIFLTALCIAVPLWLRGDRRALLGAEPLLGYFAALGLGFMLIEISQMQRLMILLGHPTYGLTVVLFALLVSSGLGSYLTAWIPPGRSDVEGVRRLWILVAVLTTFGLVTPALLRLSEASPTPIRIAVAVAVLSVPGLLMGMAFPLGIKAARGRATGLLPWLWGLNGATSVLASVLAICIALAWSISAAFWTGVACYVGAAVCLQSLRALSARLDATPSFAKRSDARA